MTVSLHSQITGATAKGDDPVILLHGVFGSLENLGVVARALSQTREVHALDLRNHGRSPHADSMTYAEMAADVRAYMDEHNLSRAAILGHSMGGKTAMRLALDEPDRVARLIVADIAPVLYEPHHQSILEGFRALDTDGLRSRSEADRALQPYVKEAQVRQFLLKNLVKREEGGYAWRLNIDAIEKCYDEIVAGQDASQPYRGPVLFIKGGESDYIQERHREKVARLFPAASLRVVPGAGHWLHAEKPDLFTTLCERFLAGEMD
jgi:esterase